MSEQPDLPTATRSAGDLLEQLIRDKDRTASILSATAAAFAPSLAISLIGAITGTQGGAAIMKSLALTGTLVGGGAVEGVTVMGIGAVFVAWLLKPPIRRLLNTLSRLTGAATERPRQ